MQACVNLRWRYPFLYLPVDVTRWKTKDEESMLVLLRRVFVCNVPPPVSVSARNMYHVACYKPVNCAVHLKVWKFRTWFAETVHQFNTAKLEWRWRTFPLWMEDRDCAGRVNVPNLFLRATRLRKRSEIDFSQLYFPARNGRGTISINTIQNMGNIHTCIYLFPSSIGIMEDKLIQHCLEYDVSCVPEYWLKTTTYLAILFGLAQLDCARPSPKIRRFIS